VSDVRTVELGQFTDENADTIAARLEDAGIVWWFKQSGRWGRTLFLGDWGTRLYVDATRLDEAKALAAEVLAEVDGRR
jgi:uncharacterized LabA/DUF88 family protein